MSSHNIPIAKRTRLQTQRFNGTNPGFCGSASGRSRKLNRETGVYEVIDVDDYHESFVKEVDDKIKGYGSASPFKTGSGTCFVYLDEDDSDEGSFQSTEDEPVCAKGKAKGRSITVDELKEEESDTEKADVDAHISCKNGNKSQKMAKASSLQSTEDEALSSSENESDDSDFSLENKNQSFMKRDKKPMDESSDYYVHEKTIAKGKAKDRSITIDECKVEESDEEESSVKEIDDKIKGYGSASPFKTGTHTYFIYSDEDDSDEGSFQSTEDEPVSSSENDKDDFDFPLSLSNMRPEQPTKKNHLEQKLKMKNIYQNTTEESSNCYVHEKTNAKGKAKACSITIDEIKEEESDTEDSFYSLDNLDSDDGFIILEEQEGDAYFFWILDSCFLYLCLKAKFITESDDKNDNESQKKRKASSLQSTEDDEDEPFSSSESENDDSDDSDFLQENKRSHQPAAKNQYSKRSDKGKVWSESVDRKEKGPSVNKTSMKRTVKKPKGESSEDEKQNVKEKHEKGRYMKVDKANPIKYKRSVKGRRKDDAGSVDAILDSIVINEDVHVKKENNCVPLKFRFDDSEDESLSQKADEFDESKRLFEEMDFALTCDEIGSYKTPEAENRDQDDYYDDIEPCERGEHGDAYFEEQTGLRCGLCGAVLVESRYVIPKLATYAPDKLKRSYCYDEQEYFFSAENLYAMGLGSDCSPVNICKQTKGTVWELVPTSTQAQMYPHQQEGFEFLWKNLVGTIELSSLQTLDPRGGSGGGGGNGGGCIISHAPGTGKTLLTIVFIESFLKKFPKCCPVIVAPANMLLTWEAEFKKWQVGFSFISLNNFDFLQKEMLFGGSRHNKDLIRAMKIRSWSNGGTVLGVSYNLFEKLAGDSNKKNTHNEKVRKFLLDMPGLVVLDEGHTPRNQNSNIWNTLLKLETKNRVILSGTPFQNNFRELFNTLRLVRPETAKSIGKEKFFADMIQPKNMKKSGGRSTSDQDIEKLKETISTFVHVHKGDILENTLPGWKQSVILLNPPPFQKGFIEKLGNSASTFAYEHKVALVSVHPSLILHCLLSDKEEKLINKQELEDVRLQPAVGVKTRFVMELIRLSLSLNEKVLIFSQYIQPSELLQDQIARAFSWEVEKEITLIKGKIHQTRRQKVINAFNDPKSELKVLLASTKCCSEGIHLYGASRVVLLDVVWNPSVEKQAISRAYRLGQKKVVYTYHLMAAGTTEEEKYDRQVAKGRLAEMVFSSASMVGGEAKNKVNVDDKILQEMVNNQEMKDMFKKIRYVENQSRI
ncbi:hypothetical protein L1987_39171 [Smallanthus sonchifolius]|uniref:Uncharacterized protein n=1 Tax=Smallanthus sonchifolius TaxID=185202 RepID=A0ACB9HL20_9ASTR|nr:hypothetical protein L1987_39171 [Smallanthus sonchifolius]